MFYRQRKHSSGKLEKISYQVTHIGSELVFKCLTVGSWVQSLHCASLPAGSCIKSIDLFFPWRACRLEHTGAEGFADEIPWSCRVPTPCWDIRTREWDPDTQACEHREGTEGLKIEKGSGQNNQLSGSPDERTCKDIAVVQMWNRAAGSRKPAPFSNRVP